MRPRTLAIHMTAAAVATLLAASATTPALHAGGHELSPEQKIVQARQGQMHLYAHNLGVLGAMAKGATPYDAQAAKAASGNLLALASMTPTSLWVADTDSMMVDGSRAMPSMWDNMEDVAAKGKGMATALVGLHEASGNGLEALQAAMGPVGKACGDCHKAYREPK